jgi:hypothetical protein
MESSSSVRYNVWHLAQRGLSGFVPPELILEQICDPPELVLEGVLSETLDSEDDRDWEEGGWVQ